MANQAKITATKMWEKINHLPVKRIWGSTAKYCGMFIGVGGFLMSKDRLKQIWTGELPLDEQVKLLRVDVAYMRGLLERVAAAQEADAAARLASAAAAPVVVPTAAAPVVPPAAVPVVASEAAPAVAPAVAPVVAPTAEN